jgi:hypothetical protein
MALLTREDILRAEKILKLARQARNPSCTGPERDAFERKSVVLAARYRFGNRMVLDGVPVLR